MACRPARRVGGMSDLAEMRLAICGRAAAGSRKASSSIGARSPVCVPTQAAWAGCSMQAVSASRQLAFSHTFLVFGRITARSLRANAALRSALFYGFLFLSIGSAIKWNGEEPEARSCVRVHGHQHS